MAHLNFEDIYRLLDEEYVPYDSFYEGEVRKLKEIQEESSNYHVLRSLQKGNEVVEKLLRDNYYALYGNEVGYEFLVKLLYNRQKLYEALYKENGLDINPNGRYVELSLNSIFLIDEEDYQDLTTFDNKVGEFFVDNWDPVIVDYQDLLNEFDKQGLSHTFKPISEMSTIVRNEGFVNPNPIVKKKILNKIYH